MHPTRLLPNCRVEPGREKSAGRDEAPVLIPDSEEAPFSSSLRDPEPELVIFGQRFCRERVPPFLVSQRSQRTARNRAADTGSRNRRAQSVAHDQDLCVRFREFVGIVRADPGGMPLGQRENRELDEMRMPQGPVQ